MFIDVGFLGKVSDHGVLTTKVERFDLVFDVGALKPDPGVSQLTCGLLGKPTEGSDNGFI